MAGYTVAISSDFFSAFAALPKAKQGRVMDFMSKFRSNPLAPGMNYEKINDAYDKNMRSVRIDDIRPTTFAMFQYNPEEFISKVIRLIKEQKATMIVEHITYNQIEGCYENSIFTADKHGKALEDAFAATKAIQDYIFTDGTAEKSIERKFVEELDGSSEVNVYAKLPRGFSIPTPVGRYTPDWAIVFYEGKVRHIYFIAETKCTMDSLNLRPIEKAKIECARKLFDALSNGTVKYDHVDNYQQLMNKVMS